MSDVVEVKVEINFFQDGVLQPLDTQSKRFAMAADRGNIWDAYLSATGDALAFLFNERARLAARRGQP
jgi:hypothetical protein